MKSESSFTQTVIDLTRSVNIALDSLIGMNEALSTSNDSVVVEVEGVDPLTGDPSLYTYTLPSYNYVLSKLSRISNSLDTFVSGNGVVLLNDGTFREVRTVPVAKAPSPISGLGIPGKFKWRNNWFYESLMNPQMFAEFDLKGSIDDRADRVLVRRLIFDNREEGETQWFLDNFAGKSYSFENAINLLETNEKDYWVDEEMQYLPIKSTEFTGRFRVEEKRTISAEEWIYLDTLNYARTTDFSQVNNLELKIGDLLRYNDSLYRITSIQVTEKRIQVTPLLGPDLITINNFFNFYSVPFEEKIVEIPLGFNECNILFFKGVNDDFNITGDSWGECVAFFSNNLTLAGSTQTFPDFYFKEVDDFGRKMEAEEREKWVPAYLGIQPDAPLLTAEQFGVIRVNTQLDAALDTEGIKSTQSEIENTRSEVNSLKETISLQKSELVGITEPGPRESLQSQIDTNISNLSKKTVQYQSLVRSLSTLAYENSAVLADPKYRIRGFFEIPLGKTLTNSPEERKQEVVQFEIEYRYLRLDGTGNPLSTFSYVDPSSGQTITGTFTDWILEETPVRERIWNEEKEVFIWAPEEISNGESYNINQIDIAIQRGEQVEIRIRSISEAGWPMNPLKSAWSEPVTIQFPPNLEGSDQVANILRDALAEETAIKLEETLNSSGVITHLQDQVPNPSGAEGTFFKHQARYIAYDLPTKDQEGNTLAINTSDLQSVVSDIATKTYVTLIRPSGASPSEPEFLIVPLSKLFQAIIKLDPSIYEELSE